MNKKGLLISIACTVVVTLCLAIYTLVSVLGVKTPESPKNVTVAVAYRTRDEIKDISKFAQKDMTFTYSGEENPAITYDEESGVYTAANAGEVTVVVKLDEVGNTKTYEIEVIEQEFEVVNAGTEDEKYYPINNIVITSREHLIEYTNLANSTESDTINFRGFNVKLYNDIDLAGYNWMPIGTRENPFYGSFDGNGYTIKGMHIQVTTTNVEQFLSTIGNEVSMYVGFFGCVDGLTTDEAGTAIGEIKNLSFDGADIQIDVEVDTAIEALMTEGKEFIQSGIGVLAGRVYGTTINGGDADSKVSNSRIKGYAVMTSKTTANGIGGLVGIALNSTNISNYNVDIAIYNDYEGASFTAADLSVEGNHVAGLVGIMQNNYSGASASAVINCDVDVTAYIKAETKVKFGGAVAVLVDVSMDGVNVVAEVTSTSPKTNDENKYSRIGGVAYYLTGSQASIKNTTVDMRASVHAIVSGFIFQNDAKIENCTVKNAVINSFYATGFVYLNKGEITYTADYTGTAVTTTLGGYVNSGFATYNENKISGYAAEGEVYTPVKVTIISKNKQFNVATNAANAFSNTAGSTGFANTSYSDDRDVVIENFNVNVAIERDVNQVGLVFNLGNYESTYKSELKNMIVNGKFTSAQTNNGTEDVSTTKYVAGAVARMFGTALVENVDVVVNVNENADVNKRYGVQFFGGIVARILEDGAIVNGSSVQGYAYFNYSDYTVSFEESGETATYQVSLVGGLVGVISNDGLAASNGQYTDTKLDQYSVISSTANVKITNNVVSDLTLIVNVGNNDIVETGHKTQNRWRVRSLGATLGSVNNADGAIALSSNTLTNVTIKTVARDYNFTTTASDNNSTLSDSIRSYGIANKVITVSEDANNDGVTYIEL